MLAEADELLGQEEIALLREVVAQDDPIEVAWIAVDILNDVDPAEGDEAWRVYTNRPDAPASRVKGTPKPT